jgi:hypothetical protein
MDLLDFEKAFLNAWEQKEGLVEDLHIIESRLITRGNRTQGAEITYFQGHLSEGDYSSNSKTCHIEVVGDKPKVKF